MATQVSSEEIGKIKQIKFEVTNTLRNQPVNVGSVGGDYVIDVDGLIYKNGGGSKTSATVTLVGGVSHFIHEKSQRGEPLFYLSEPQKWILMSILKQVSVNFFDADLSSSTPDLDDIVNTMYFNSLG